MKENMDQDLTLKPQGDGVRPLLDSELDDVTGGKLVMGEDGSGTPMPIAEGG